MDIREQRQREFEKLWIDNKDKRGILVLSPRLGKTRIGLDIGNEIAGHILIAYPSKTIKQSWLDEIDKLEMDLNAIGIDVTFTTYKSLHKQIGKKWDLVIADEVHSMSTEQMKSLNKVLNDSEYFLGLTGTLNTWTEKELNWECSLEVLGRYTIEQAINDGVISDYEIRIVEVDLDKSKKTVYKTKQGSYTQTEYSRYSMYSGAIARLEADNKDTFALRIKRMQLLQNSEAKWKKTKELIDLYKDNRVLVFCGTKKMADSFGIPSYHSSSKEGGLLESFCKGEGNHLASVKMLSAGITFLPLEIGIINYVDSNSENFGQKVARFLNYEYKGKKAIIYIVITNTKTEKQWVKQALEFLNPKKVIWDYKI